jgi:hypothetical protein
VVTRPAARMPRPLVAGRTPGGRPPRCSELRPGGRCEPGDGAAEGVPPRRRSPALARSGSSDVEDLSAGEFVAAALDPVCHLPQRGGKLLGGRPGPCGRGRSCCVHPSGHQARARRRARGRPVHRWPGRDDRPLPGHRRVARTVPVVGDRPSGVILTARGCRGRMLQRWSSQGRLEGSNVGFHVGGYEPAVGERGG